LNKKSSICTLLKGYFPIRVHLSEIYLGGHLEVFKKKRLLPQSCAEKGRRGVRQFVRKIKSSKNQWRRCSLPLPLSLSLSLSLFHSLPKLNHPCTDYGSGTPLPDSSDYLWLNIDCTRPIEIPGCCAMDVNLEKSYSLMKVHILVQPNRDFCVRRTVRVRLVSFSSSIHARRYLTSTILPRENVNISLRSIIGRRTPERTDSIVSGV